MRPIIINMKDMSDSIEVYEARPNREMIYIIYLLAAMLLVGVGWMYLSDIDIVVKSNGVFRSVEDGGQYYAEIYVEPQNVARITEGQQVKFETAEYPSGEYGCFTGTVMAVSKEIKVESSSGSAYYLVTVRCDQTAVTSKEGKQGTITNGMVCQAKVTVDEKNVLRYLLEMLGLV